MYQNNENIEKDIIMGELLYKSLYGKLSGDEQIMLECWLKDQDNREFYEDLLQPGNLYEDLLEMSRLDTGQYYSKLQRQMNRKRRLRLWWMLASSAAVLLPVVWLFWPFLQEVKTDSGIPYLMVQETDVDKTTLETGEGKVYWIDDSIKQIRAKEVVVLDTVGSESPFRGGNDKTAFNLLATSSRGNIAVTLSDSTRVWLNAGSKLRYPNRFTQGRREVELSGEAYFEVVRNDRQPFIVKAGTTQIEVLGTQFNVNVLGKESCVTTLVEGSVKVHNARNDSVIIHPGQQVNVLPEGAMSVKSVDTRFYTAWKRNRFAFQNEPFYRIMGQLSEWYGFTFEFSRSGLANLHFTTMLPRYDEITQVLEVLQLTGEFQFVEQSGHIYITD